MTVEHDAIVRRAIDAFEVGPADFSDYANLMFSLLALTFQCDLTRVATFMIGRELSMRTYPEIGIVEQVK